MKKNKNFMADNNIFLIGASLIIVVILVAIAFSKEMNDKGLEENEEGTPGVRSGQQVAKVSILPADGSSQEETPLENQGVTSDSTSVDVQKRAVVAAGDRVKFKISSFQKLAVQPLKFNLYDEQGKELTPDYLQTHNEHKVHFVLVSANFKDYLHLYPEYRNGVWNVSANMPSVGTYYAYVDIVPVKGSPVVLRSDLVVRDPSTENIAYPGLNPDMVAVTDGIQSKLTVEPAMVGVESKLSFSLSSAGKPADTIKPYLGSLGHVVVMHQGEADSYVHVSPLMVQDETKGIVDFAATFEKKGRYTAFAEFNVGGKVRLFITTFDIK